MVASIGREAAVISDVEKPGFLKFWKAESFGILEKWAALERGGLARPADPTSPHLPPTDFSGVKYPGAPHNIGDNRKVGLFIPQSD